MKKTTGKKPVVVKKSVSVKAGPAKAGVTMQEVRAIAKSMGFSTFGKSKTDIIRSIQRAEGNFDCYANAKAGFCDQTGCCWHGDCIEESVKPAK